MSDFEPKDLEIKKTVDARGTACPGPLLEAKKGIGSVPINGVMEILSSDGSTRADLPVWAKKVGHEFLGVKSEDGFDRIFIRRKR
ncbi:sulfurtransferase TusA family protein [Candidatus Bipolaricaulota bacterium]|nr:sulfurtransferase TusA family protein [Candidatus Bipolaricaulota bacterium]